MKLSNKRKQWLRKKLDEFTECHLMNFGSNLGWDVHYDLRGLLDDNAQLEADVFYEDSDGKGVRYKDWCAQLLAEKAEFASDWKYNFEQYEEQLVNLKAELGAVKQRNRSLETTPLATNYHKLEAEYKWMRREIERVGRALFTGTITGYVGTEEDLHAIGQTVEGVCETLDALLTEDSDAQFTGGTTPAYFSAQDKAEESK